MATGAAADDLEMIDADDRFPLVGRVAVLAHLGGVDVVQAFTGLDGAVMAADATGADAGVVKRRRQPAFGAVAIAAFRDRG